MVQCKNCGNELPDGAAHCPKCGVTVGGGTQITLAFWGERFIAWLIDIVILGIIIGIMRLFSWIAWPGYVWAQGAPNWIPFLNFGSSNVLYFIYWLLMDGIYGQSLGKMIMRLKVRGLNGEPIDMGRAALESVGKAFLLPIDCILGWIFYPRKRQRMFNYLSQTIVVRSSR